MEPRREVHIMEQLAEVVWGLMVVIGILVGGMVIGMYLPIFKLAATIG